MEERLSQKAKRGQGYTSSKSIRLSTKPTTRDFIIPEGTTGELASFIKSLFSKPEIRCTELRDIRVHFEGGKEALGERYFPKPATTDDEVWEANKRLLTHVNLVKPAVRAWVNAVYSEEPYRSVEKNPRKDVISAWVESDSYAQAVYDWTINKVAYGTAVFVPIYDPVTKEIDVWLPHPVHTYIFVDPFNRRKVIGVAEITQDRIQFIHEHGEGLLIAGEESRIVHHNFGWLPVAVGYGEGRSSFGEVYGVPMVRDALHATYAATMVWFNVRLLQRQQTKSILKRVGDPEDMEAQGRFIEGVDAGIVDIPAGGNADFISPQPRIKESIDVLRQQVGLFSTASGISPDILDPTLTDASVTAEGSRIRALPFIQNSKPFIRQNRSDERHAVLAATGLVVYMESGKTYLDRSPINYPELKAGVETDIGLQSSIIPQHPNEETQDVIAKVSFGLMTAEDAARRLNGTKTKKQILEMAAEIKRRIELQGAQSLAQSVLGGGKPTQEESKLKAKNDALKPREIDHNRVDQ